MTETLTHPTPTNKARFREGHRNDNTLAKKFRELRKKAGFTQVELARKAEVGLAQIRKLEQGNHNVSFSTIKTVCKTLDADIYIDQLD
jgi:transcriptional regulator with XRE-family HTH domain